MAIDTTISNLRAQIQHRLPSQPFHNPKENVSAMTLRSGKQLKEPRKNREVEHELELNKPEPNQHQDTTFNVKKIDEDKKGTLQAITTFS